MYDLVGVRLNRSKALDPHIFISKVTYIRGGWLFRPNQIIYTSVNVRSQTSG